jgi:hypothetical protein
MENPKILYRQHAKRWYCSCDFSWLTRLMPLNNGLYDNSDRQKCVRNKAHAHVGRKHFFSLPDFFVFPRWRGDKERLMFTQRVIPCYFRFCGRVDDKFAFHHQLFSVRLCFLKGHWATTHITYYYVDDILRHAVKLGDMIA